MSKRGLEAASVQAITEANIEATWKRAKEPLARVSGKRHNENSGRKAKAGKRSPNVMMADLSGGHSKNKKSATENQIENGKCSTRRMMQVAWHGTQEEGGGCEG